MKLRPLFAFSLLLFSLRAENEETYTPLYAGTQLAFFPTNAAPGHFAVQPFLFYIHNNGAYNSHWSEKKLKATDSLAYLLSLETGITDWLDISLYLNGAYRHYGNQSSFVIGDTTVLLGIQFTHDKRGTWIPDLRLMLGETFPTGKFDHLDPHKNRSDVFGTGTYTTFLVFILAKTFYTIPNHPYNLNLNIYYLQPSHTSTHKQSLYSPLPGKALPGPGFITNLALELSLTRNWALGLDLHYVHQNKTIFKPSHAPSQTLPSSEQFSLSPCLEYSWSENFSTALGPWFTVTGRNSVSFIGFCGNLYCYF